MKKILTIALLLIAINAQGQGLPVAANATLASLFPDENLRRVVAEHLGPNAGLVGQRLSDELAGIIELDASNPFLARTRGLETRIIHNANGVEYLLNLVKLNLDNNRLLNIDVSNNISLTSLSVDNNLLTNLDVSSNIYLTGLFVGRNRLISIDVSKLINLTSLFVASNRLTSLDVSSNISLTSLLVDSNPLTNLDVSSNINLITLSVLGTNLTSLDISKNIKLEQLDTDLWNIIGNRPILPEGSHGNYPDGWDEQDTLYR
ncbi:MAG: hypothetical protein FWE37_03140 [Spirochaetaceae bacterium]|nr:hypothetical protein [Spirochaetaceae bacterium]